MSGFSRHNTLLKKMGKYKTGKSCLYVKQMSDIDLDVLKKLIEESVNYLKKKSA
jgi:hypothetical protein